MPRPKKLTPRGFNEHSGFWEAILARVGQKLVKDGHVGSTTEWNKHVGADWWIWLKEIALEPRQLSNDAVLRELGHIIAREPVIAPLVLGHITQAIRTGNRIEMWLHYFSFTHDLARASDFEYKELAAMFERETGFGCTDREMSDAQENMARRIAKFSARTRGQTGIQHLAAAPKAALNIGERNTFANDPRTKPKARRHRHGKANPGVLPTPKYRAGSVFRTGAQ